MLCTRVFGRIVSTFIFLPHRALPNNSKIGTPNWLHHHPASYKFINSHIFILDEEQAHHHPKNQTFLPGLSSSVSGQSPGYTYKSDAIQKQAANTRWLSFKTQTLFQSFLHQVPRPVPRLLKLKIWGKPLWPHLNPGSWIWPITGGFLWQSDCFDHWRQVNSYQTPVNYSAGRTLRRGISLFPPICSNIAFNDNMCENVWHNLFCYGNTPSKQLKNC